MSEQVERKRVRRIAAAFAALFLTAVLLLSSLYIISNAEHDCVHHESCPICSCIESCKQLATNTIFASAAVSAVLFTVLFGGTTLSLWIFAANSLINLKIRLNN